MDSFLSGITSEMICTVLLIGGGGILWGRKNNFRFTPLDFIFLAFIGWYGGRILFRDLSCDRWGVVQIVGYGLLYFCFRCIRLEKRFFVLLFIAGIVQVMGNVLQVWEVFPSSPFRLSEKSCFFNPAISGIFLVLSALSGIVLFHKKLQSGIKFLWAVGFVLLLSGIFVSGSRASWVAFGVGCLWLFFTGDKGKNFICSKGIGQNYRLLKYSLFLLLCGSGFCFFLYVLYCIRPDSVQGRLLIWQVIGSRLSEAPWFGQGPLQALYMPFQAAWFRANPDSGFAMMAGNNLYAFNEFLRFAFETGITGLFLFMSLMIGSGYYALKGNRFSRYAGGLWLAVVSFGLFSYPFSTGLISMISVILLALISQTIFYEKRPAGNYRIYIRWGGYFLGSLFFIFTSFEYVLEKKADRLLAEARHDPAVLTGKPMTDCCKRLQGNADFMLCYGKALCDRALYREALPVLEQAYRLKPSSELVCDLGRCYQAAKKYDRAEEAYSLAVSMVPAYIVPHYRLFCLYRKTGNLEKAVAEAGYMLTMPVKVVNTSVLRAKNEARIFLKDKLETE